MNKTTKELIMGRFKVPEKIIELVQETEEEINDNIKQFQQIREHNQYKVLASMQETGLSERHFYPSSGYGYGDQGRETLEKVLANIFSTEDALVRPQIVSGTHAIALCLSSILKPGDHLVSITGKPYDTLQTVIGTKGNEQGNLIENGITSEYIQLNNNKIDYDYIRNNINSKTRLVLFQRSRGYAWRPSFGINDIGASVKVVKSINKDIIFMVDNCYGEFTETEEPSNAGADITAGSLIKNPGGGLAPTGGYIAGRKPLIDIIANRLTCPGLGKDVGSYNASYRPFFQGLFLAPHIVFESLKGCVLCSRLFEKLGYEVLPAYDDYRSDITQAIKLNCKERLIAFCQGIQKASPVDSSFVPQPWQMPGYSHKVIMASGTFIQGASIELTADAPVKPPYIVYFQGGLTYDHIKIGLMTAINNIVNQSV